MNIKTKLDALAKRIAKATPAKEYPRGGVIARIEHYQQLLEQAAETGFESPELTAILDEDGGRCRRWMERAWPGIIAAVERDQRAQGDDDAV